MSHAKNDQSGLSETEQDSRADIKAIVVVFVCAIAMAMHFVSGFTFDF